MSWPLSPAVPQFDVALLTCVREDRLGRPPCRAPHCSLRARGRLFTFSFRPELGLLTASYTSERVVNASLGVLGRPPPCCLTGGRTLLPPGAAAWATYCSGHLVSGSLPGVGHAVPRVWLLGPGCRRPPSTPHTAQCAAMMPR